MHGMKKSRNYYINAYTYAFPILLERARIVCINHRRIVFGPHRAVEMERCYCPVVKQEIVKQW